MPRRLGRERLAPEIFLYFAWFLRRFLLGLGVIKER
jgi:hypothetical protein